MNSLTEYLSNNAHWNELTATIQNGSVPGAIGVEIRSGWQNELMISLARRILCEHGNACGECKSCHSWVEDTHPDLLIAGEPDTPAPVDECRRKSSDLPMSPVVSTRRLLVFFAPEKMSPGAVNSLLKITEEPPPHGHILYLMSKAAILPTLRSRLWMLSFSLEEIITPVQPPVNQNSWINWLKEVEKYDADDWYAAAHGYAAWLSQNGDAAKAAQLQQLAETAMLTHLSAPMWSDLLFLHLRGEYPFEHVFDDFRQTPLPGVDSAGRRK